MGPKSRWGGVRLLFQTRPIPRSPDGDKKEVPFRFLKENAREGAEILKVTYSEIKMKQVKWND